MVLLSSFHMKNYLFLLLLLCLVSPLAFAQGPSGKVFNVAKFGAKGNNTANDIAAVRLALAAANAAGGGILDFPDGTYKLQVGDPTSDANYTSLGSNNYGMLNVTADNITFRLAPAATIRVIATYLCQTNAGSDAACRQIFINYSGTRTGFQIIGHKSSKITWETGSPAALFECVNCANAFQFHAGSPTYSKYRDFIIDGFPQGGSPGGITIGAFTWQYNEYENVRVTNYGGGNHDAWWYYQGGNTVRNCLFQSTRTYQSHTVYIGTLRPGNLFDHCTFRGVVTSTKYVFHLYQTLGTDDISDITIQNCWFEGNSSPILLSHVGSGKGRNVRIINNTFIGNDPSGSGPVAMNLTNLLACEISGNYFTGWSAPITLTTSGDKSIITKNYIKSCYAGIVVQAFTDGVISENVIAAQDVGINANGAILATTGSHRTKIVNNQVINFASGTGGPQLIAVGGDDVLVQGNMLYQSDASFILYGLNVGGARAKVLDNHINLGSGYSIFAGSDLDIRGNNSNRLMIIDSSTTGISYFTGNRFVGGGAPRINAKTFVYNNELVSGYDGSGANGVYNATGNRLVGADKLDHIDDTFGASYTPNAGYYRSIAITLSGNITINAPTNPVAGRELTFVLTQNGTGGWTTTFNAVFKSSWTPNTTAGKINVITFRYVGSSWIQVASTVGI